MAETKTILVADDDPSVRYALAFELAKNGYRVILATTSEEVLEKTGDEYPSLAIIDLALSHGEALALIAHLRGASAIPVIAVGSGKSEAEKVKAVQAGATDYFTKPFSLVAMLHRVIAQLRLNPLDHDVISFEGLTIDRKEHKVLRDDREVTLSAVEFTFLELMARNAGRAVPEQEVVHVLRPGSKLHGDVVRAHFASLKRKLEKDAANPRFIQFEPWLGYRLIATPLD